MSLKKEYVFALRVTSPLKQKTLSFVSRNARITPASFFALCQNARKSFKPSFQKSPLPNNFYNSSFLKVKGGHL